MLSRSLRSALFHLQGRTDEVLPNLRLSPFPAVKQDPLASGASSIPAAAGGEVGESSARPGKASARPGAPGAARSALRSAGTDTCALQGRLSPAGHEAGPTQRGLARPGDVQGEEASGAARGEGGKP